MGGLLLDWSYNSGGISKFFDVVVYWDEVSLYYDMLIDGDIWLEDLFFLFYLFFIVYKVVEMQDKRKVIVFLWELCEMVFI